MDVALLVRVAAGSALALLLFWFFRIAMGLRYAKVSREDERRAEEARGRHLVSEVPGANGELVLFFDGPEAFSWGQRTFAKAEVLAARLVLNGRAIDEAARAGVELPRMAAPDDEEGRERWEVVLTLASGQEFAIPCGRLREGVSRDAAKAVFSAVARTVAEPAVHHHQGGGSLKGGPK